MARSINPIYLKIVDMDRRSQAELLTKIVEFIIAPLSEDEERARDEIKELIK